MTESLSSKEQKNIRGMILAAGFGKRLAPLTDHLPKPLLPVGSGTLLDHAIASLDAAGIHEIAVNTHHLGNLVQTHLEERLNSGRFTVFHEPEILGTGGALYGAGDFLRGCSHFVLHNADILSNAEVAGLVRHHLESGALATLLLTDWPAVNSVIVDDRDWILGIGGSLDGWEPQLRRLTYTGIGIFRSELLRDIGPGFSSLIDPLIRAMDRDPGTVRAYVPDGLEWDDLGTFRRYLTEAEKHPGATEDSLEIKRLTGHGSDRRFWRLSGPDFSLVTMVCPDEDPEFERFVAIGRWLPTENLGAPAITAVHEVEKTVVMEDLGPDSLYHLAQGHDGEGIPLENAYEKIVVKLLQLQKNTQMAREKCPLATDRCLDREQLLWETGYFQERFLAGHCGLPDKELQPLQEEFELLAQVVARQPRVLIHRDFQSQNIHFKNGQVRLVDFQGMRLGPLGYDIMSLAFDPYVDLDLGFRLRVLDRFCRDATGQYTPSAVKAMALAAGLQRIMQALGAFSFLGHAKGKREFLSYIPRGNSLLKALLALELEAYQTGTAQDRTWLPGPLPHLQGLMEDLKPSADDI